MSTSSTCRLALRWPGAKSDIQIARKSAEPGPMTKAFSGNFSIAKRPSGYRQHEILQTWEHVISVHKDSYAIVPLSLPK